VTDYARARRRVAPIDRSPPGSRQVDVLSWHRGRALRSVRTRHSGGCPSSASTTRFTSAIVAGSLAQLARGAAGAGSAYPAGPGGPQADRHEGRLPLHGGFRAPASAPYHLLRFRQGPVSR